MKKRIRKTGEIVDVIDYSCIDLIKERDDRDWVSYIDSKDIEYHCVKGLNFYWDFEDVVEVTNTDIDWDKVRIKAAISALQVFCSNAITFDSDDDKLVKWSVSCADALIAELKKGGEK